MVQTEGGVRLWERERKQMNGAAMLTPLRTNHARLRNHERTGRTAPRQGRFRPDGRRDFPEGGGESAYSAALLQGHGTGVSAGAGADSGPVPRHGQSCAAALAGSPVRRPAPRSAQRGEPRRRADRRASRAWCRAAGPQYNPQKQGPGSGR